MASIERLRKIYPCSLSFIGPRTEPFKNIDPEAFQDALEKDYSLPPFLSELARLELSIYKVSNSSIAFPHDIEKISINPTSQMLQLSWKNLSSLLKRENAPAAVPEPGKEYVLIWKDPKSNKTKVRRASDDELLALKIIVEELNPEKVSEEGNFPIGAIDGAIDRAVRKGFLPRAARASH